MPQKSFHKRLLKSKRIETFQNHQVHQVIDQMINTKLILFILHRARCNFYFLFLLFNGEAEQFCSHYLLQNFHLCSLLILVSIGIPVFGH